MLHVYDDLGVVDQHPTAVALALTAYGLGAELSQGVLDALHDGLDLAVVGPAGDQERVGDGQLVADVEGEEIECPLHGARFHVPTGRCTKEPGGRDLKTYPIKIENNRLEGGTIGIDGDKIILDPAFLA